MNNHYSHIVWLGAGSATEPQGILEHTEKATLVDSRKTACAALQKSYTQDSISIRQLLITTDGNSYNFTEFNLPEYSAIKPPSGLTTVFPGLKAVKSEKTNSVQINELIQSLSLKEKGNLLIMDILDLNFELLVSLTKQNQLHYFDDIYVLTGVEPLYASAATLDDLTQLLQQNGYLLQSQLNTDPDIPRVKFSINPLWNKLQEALLENKKCSREIKQLNEAIAAKQREIEGKNQEFIKIKTSYEERISEMLSSLSVSEKNTQDARNNLTELHQNLAIVKQQLADQAKQIDDQNLKISEQRKYIDKQKLQIADQTQKIEELQMQQGIEQKLQDSLKDQSHSMIKELGNVKNNLQTALTNSTKQLEAFISIHNYLDGGIKPLSFHGWPISPDIGLYIIGLIDTNNYDGIIEFGSGTSTVLMAKALLAKRRHSLPRQLKTSSQEKEIELHNVNYNDLPSRIITFEHSATYHEKTSQLLIDNQIDHLVDLVHAPLIDYQHKDGTQYLYYNCNEKLQELSRIFKGRKAKLLVLVDGPPGATNKNARFPALPHLLNTLPEHSYTVIMDDYNRPEEREITKLWLEILEARSMKFAFEEIKCEKGCAVINIE